MDIASLLVVAVIVVLVIIIFRNVIVWLYGVNEVISGQKEIIRLLKKSIGEETKEDKKKKK